MHKRIIILLILVLVIRIFTYRSEFPENVPVRITGRVLQDPVVYDNKKLLVVNGLRAYVDLYPEVIYGDRVVIEGKIEGKQVHNAKVVNILHGSGIYSVREKILSSIKRSLPEPHASLVAGITLGSKEDMPEDFWEDLKSTGTAHVVVASGMNVTFVILFLINVLVRFLNRRRAIVLSVLGAWLYVALSGFDAPLIRAAVMGTIAFSAQEAGRVSSSIRALILSALLMLIVKPVWMYDLGFILSFTATLSLIIFEPKVSRLLHRVPIVFRDDLATTLSAQLGVSPILLITFGQFNLLSPLINALVLWTIPPIMIIGGAASLVSLIVPPLGELLIFTAYPFTYWFVGVINIMS